jgi:hypothetical protein
VFEQKAAQQTNVSIGIPFDCLTLCSISFSSLFEYKQEYIDEENIKRQREARKAELERKREMERRKVPFVLLPFCKLINGNTQKEAEERLKREEEEAARREAERKKKVQENLARFKAGIHGN